MWWHSFWSTLVQGMAYGLMAPSHYLNQWWFNVNYWYIPKNKFQWSLNQIQKFSLKKMWLKMSSAECQPFCSSPNVLMVINLFRHLPIQLTHWSLLWPMDESIDKCLEMSTTSEHRSLTPAQWPMNESILLGRCLETSRAWSTFHILHIGQLLAK